MHAQAAVPVVMAAISSDNFPSWLWVMFVIQGVLIAMFAAGYIGWRRRSAEAPGPAAAEPDAASPAPPASHAATSELDATVLPSESQEALPDPENDQ